MAYGGYSRLRVLVVDDFDSFRMTVSKILNDFGVEQVDTVANGQEAIKQCVSKQYDLVLCDYNLGPGKTGQQILEELRQRNAWSATNLFCLVSAESSKSIVLAAYDSAPDAYLTKPITAKTLQQRLDRLLAERDEKSVIHKLWASGDKQGAIEECKRKISGQSRYAASCQKLLAQLYIETDQIDLAETIYRQVLEVRQLEWAQLGLAHVKQLQGELDQADQWLCDIIQKNPMSMQAYDMLAENCRLQNDDIRLQEVLEQAVAVSPMALMRQQSLASTARDNNDLLVAAQAYKRSVRLGKNSCHDSAQTHIEFGRTAAALCDENSVEGADLARDALRTLEAVGKQFNLNESEKFQTNLVEVQIYTHQGDKTRANNLLQDIEKTVVDDNIHLDVDASLDLVLALSVTGKKDRSDQLLKSLIEDYKNDQDAMDKIDRVLDEPVSDVNRKQVGQLNKKGIRFYEEKNYAEAVKLFLQARRLFPNHLGVQLNLVQAVLGEMREYGVEPTAMQTCLDSLAKVEKKMTPSHAQMKRYRQLSDMLRTVERESQRA